ncbi:MAG TPA: hypothetical protein VFS76_20490 [Pyrinomonadaceae bacterium]|nr:hypothetical protein [Pyrinomonadaceae bacterium]
MTDLTAAACRLDRSGMSFGPQRHVVGPQRLVVWTAAACRLDRSGLSLDRSGLSLDRSGLSLDRSGFAA